MLELAFGPKARPTCLDYENQTQVQRRISMVDPLNRVSIAVHSQIPTQKTWGQETAQ